MSDSRPRTLARALLALAWFLCPAYGIWQAAGLLVHFLGESATPAEQEAAARWLCFAAATAVVASAGCLLLSAGRRAGTVGWSAALVLSLLLAVAVAPQAARLLPDRPLPPAGPGACQERSGGPSTCPGG